MVIEEKQQTRGINRQATMDEYPLQQRNLFHHHETQVLGLRKS